MGSVSLVYLASLALYARVRPLDGDEGLYSTAARQVWEGKIPYRDFFYQQAPLMPYFYSWVWGAHPHSLVAMRLLSVLCGVVATFLWGAWAVSFSDRIGARVAFAAFCAVLLNPYWAWWNSVVKTYALANLLVTIGTFCLYLAIISGRRRWFYSAGVALGACASLRLFYAFLAPSVLFWAFLNRRRFASFGRNVRFFLAGSLCGLVPMIVSFVGSPSPFLFDNLEYHHIDTGYLESANGTITRGYQSVGHTVLVYFATVVVRLVGMHPYFSISLVLALAGWYSLRKLRRDGGGPYTQKELLYFDAAAVLLIVYAATALIHFPPYDQDFDSQLVPLLTPFVLEGLRSTFSGKRRLALGFGLALIAPVLMVGEIGRDPWLPGSPAVWQLRCYRAVTQAIEDNSRPDGVVLSFWPGFVFESDRKYFPGLENDYSLRIMDRLSPEQRVLYHLTSFGQIMNSLGSRQVDTLVIHPRIYEYFETLTPDQVQAFREAVNSNYLPVADVQGIEIYKRRTTDAIPSGKSRS